MTTDRFLWEISEVNIELNCQRGFFLLLLLNLSGLCREAWQENQVKINSLGQPAFACSGPSRPTTAPGEVPLLP